MEERRRRDDPHPTQSDRSTRAAGAAAGHASASLLRSPGGSLRAAPVDHSTAPLWCSAATDVQSSRRADAALATKTLPRATARARDLFPSSRLILRERDPTDRTAECSRKPTAKISAPPEAQADVLGRGDGENGWPQRRGLPVVRSSTRADHRRARSDFLSPSDEVRRALAQRGLLDPIAPLAQAPARGPPVGQLELPFPGGICQRTPVAA